MIFAWDPRIWHDTSLAVSNVQQMIILRDCFRFILISMKCELSRRPTWFSFQVSRQFLLSLFLAPLCLIITLIMFSDRIITVSLTPSLYVLRWPPPVAGVAAMVSPLSSTTPTTDSKLVTGDLDSSLANLASNLNFGPAANRFVRTLKCFKTCLFLNLATFQEFRWGHC